MFSFFSFPELRYVATHITVREEEEEEEI